LPPLFQTLEKFFQCLENRRRPQKFETLILKGGFCYKAAPISPIRRDSESDFFRG
jgi:hypothetical protein